MVTAVNRQKEGETQMIGKLLNKEEVKEEKTMRLGITVPQFGPDAGPDALLEVARLAEDLGYDSLWVAERLL